MTITAVVRNQGKAAADSVLVRFEDVTNEDEPTLIGDYTIENPIQPGARELAVMPFSTSGLTGARTIRVTADPENEIAETSKDDNSAERTLRFSSSATGRSSEEGADASVNLALSAQGVEVNVVPSQESDLVIVATTVRNEGNSDVGGFAVHVLDVSDNFSPLGSPQTVEGLAAGSETTVRTVFRAAGGIGARTLQVVVDPMDEIAESSEQDNRVSVLVNPTGQASQ